MGNEKMTEYEKLLNLKTLLDNDTLLKLIARYYVLNEYCNKDMNKVKKYLETNCKDEGEIKSELGIYKMVKENS